MIPTGAKLLSRIAGEGGPNPQGLVGEGLHQPLNALSQSATGENWDRSGS